MHSTLQVMMLVHLPPLAACLLSLAAQATSHPEQQRHCCHPGHELLHQPWALARLGRTGLGKHADLGAHHLQVGQWQGRLRQNRTATTKR